GNILLDALVSTEANRPPANTAWLIGTALLHDLAITLIAYGVLALLGAWLAGPSRPATWVRSKVAPVVARGPLLVHGIGVVVFLMWIAWGPSAGGRQLLGVLVVAALFFFGLELLRRQTLRDFPPEGAAQVKAEGTAPALGS